MQERAAPIPDDAIEAVTADRSRRTLGETQEGGGPVSRMVPGNWESRHAEWKRIADANRARAVREPLP